MCPPPPSACLLTYDCKARYPSNHIVKFADDTAVVGLISNNNEVEYRREVEHLELWCRANNLCINVKKTKEMVVDFRKSAPTYSPLYIGGDAVEVVTSFKYLGVHIANNLTWKHNSASLIKKAHQRVYFLRRLKRAGLGRLPLSSLLSIGVQWRREHHYILQIREIVINRNNNVQSITMFGTTIF